MNKLKEFFISKIKYFRDVNTSIEKKNFYLVMIASSVIYFFLIVLFLLNKRDISILKLSVLMEILTICISFIANFTNNEKTFGFLYSLLLNFLVCPLYFFALGDIYNGITIFFVLSIVVTVFLHTNAKFLSLYILIENINYVIIVLFVYLNKTAMEPSRRQVHIVHSIIMCFIFASIYITFLCVYQTFIYNNTCKNLDEANKEIYVAQSSKSRFLANMTHEIRTPMNAIIGMTNLILKDEINNEVKEQVNMVKESSSDLLRIINDILEFSKLDSGKVELFNTEYSFKSLITGLVNNVSEEYIKKNIELSVSVDKNIPDTLFGDDAKIKQIFRYILFSSLSQSEHGTTYINIDGVIDDEEKNVDIICRIASTGAGFSDIELSSMFNAYSNYDSRQKSNFKGMGLELNICKSMLNLMNGDLNIESIEGIGTAVVFNFKNYIVEEKGVATDYDLNCRPLIYINNKKYEGFWQKLMSEMQLSAVYARSISGFKNALENTRFTHIFVHYIQLDEIKELLESFECKDITYVIGDYNTSYGDYDDYKILRSPIYSLNIIEALNNTWNPEDYKRQLSEEIVTYPNAKVLIVDDSLINLKVEESLLSNYSIVPKLANSGREALDILKRELFDLVLLDQKMPEFDGIDTIHELRASDYIQNDIPVICVTAEFGSDTKEKLKKEGFDDYLAKPINLKYFERVLMEYLPEELRMTKSKDTIVISDIKTKKNNQNTDSNNNTSENSGDKIDLYMFDPSIGIKNLGDNVEAYLSVLSAYYEEGLKKIIDVPEQLARGDISLYTTNVHALKSSSATVGAMGISPKFKALEFAGKDNNIEFINANSVQAFEALTVVLEKVKEYLISQNAFSEDDSIVDEDSEKFDIDVTILTELSNCISSMNLRRCEEIIDDLCSKNYGHEANIKIKKIKDSYENFEYMEIKDIINELIV